MSLERKQWAFHTLTRSRRAGDTDLCGVGGRAGFMELMGFIGGT